MKIMNVASFTGIVLILILFSLSCRTIAGQPLIKKVEVIPTEITVGDTAIIQVIIKDKHHLIQKVEAVVKEDPRIKLKLKDDGIEPDKKANDGIWILKVDVPSEAEPGTYNLEVTTYTKDDIPIRVKAKSGEVKPLSAEIPVIIKR